MKKELEFFKIVADLIKDNKESIVEKIMSIKDNIDFEIVESLIKNKSKEEKPTPEVVNIHNSQLQRFYDGLYIKIPGFSKDNININLEKETNTINITGECVSSFVVNNLNVSYVLEKNEIINKVNLENGILTIHLKKEEKEKIKINID